MRRDRITRAGRSGNALWKGTRSVSPRKDFNFLQDLVRGCFWELLNAHWHDHSQRIAVISWHELYRREFILKAEPYLLAAKSTNRIHQIARIEGNTELFPCIVDIELLSSFSDIWIVGGKSQKTWTQLELNGTTAFRRENCDASQRMIQRIYR